MKKILFLYLLLAYTYTNAQPYKVIAYYTGNADSLKLYPLNKLTHIIYSFLHVRNDSLTFDSEEQKENVKKIIALKDQHPHLKIMVSLGGWGGCEPCSQTFSTAAQREIFTTTTAALLKENKIDGIDLDWEYPAIEGYPGHRYDSTDRHNFTELVQSLRNKMGKDFLLSFAAGGFEDYLNNSIEWDAVMSNVDFVNLMTYDLVNGYSKVTGHHTPLKGYRHGQQSTDKCVKWLLQHGIKKEQLIIGAAFYARVWEKVPAENNGLYKAGSFKEGISYKKFKTYFSNASGYKYYWDEKSKAPWQYNKIKQLFATFDDERSIKAKVQYVRSNRLGGIMFWELVDDKYSGGLVDAIDEAMK